MNRLTDGTLANYRWWMWRQTFGIAHNGWRATRARLHFLTAPQSLSNKKAKQTAVMHRRLHMLLVQHGARPAPWKTETLHACDPCAISQHRAGEPTQKRHVRRETRIIRYAGAKARNNGKRHPTLPWMVPPHRKTRPSAAKVHRARETAKLNETCTKLVRNLSQKQAKLRNS